MNPIIEQALPQLHELCIKHHVAHLCLFGSATGLGFNSESDIDLVVSFHANAIVDYAENYFALLEGLESLLRRKVDLVSDRAIRNPYFREAIDESKVLLYHGQAA